jgi:hypothetical protein
MCISRLLFLSFALGLCVSEPRAAQESLAPLNGHIETNQYVSPTGTFRVTIPVSPTLGGTISDTENVVTFQDNFNTHQSIACFKMDATQRWELEARGRKDYLIWFFSNFVEADFERRFTGARVESAHFLGKIESGSLLTYNLLPGGSMFASKIVINSNEQPPVAKRGNLVFLRNDHILILSIELSEKVLEGAAFTQTVAEEDDLLRQRLLSLLGKMTFSTPPAMPVAEKTTAPAQTTVVPAK